MKNHLANLSVIPPVIRTLCALTTLGLCATAQDAEPTGVEGFVSFTWSEVNGGDVLAIVDTNLIGTGVDPKLTVDLKRHVTNTSNRRAMMAPLETKIESVPFENGIMWFVPTHETVVTPPQTPHPNPPPPSSSPLLETITILPDSGAPNGLQIIKEGISLGSQGGPYDILFAGNTLWANSLDAAGNLIIHRVPMDGTPTPKENGRINLGVAPSPYATSVTYDDPSGNLIVPTFNGAVVLNQTTGGFAVAQTVTFPAGEVCGTNIAAGFKGPNVRTLVMASLDPLVANVAGSYAIIDPAGAVAPIMNAFPPIGASASELSFGHNNILITDAPNGNSTATILTFDGTNYGGSATLPGAIVQIRNDSAAVLSATSLIVPTVPFGDPEPTISGGIETGPAIVLGSGNSVDLVLAVSTGAVDPIGSFGSASVPTAQFFSLDDNDRAYSLPNSHDAMIPTRSASGSMSLDSYTTRPGPAISLNSGSLGLPGVGRVAGLPGVIRSLLPGLDLPVYGQGFPGTCVVGFGGALGSPPVYSTVSNLTGTAFPSGVTIVPPLPASRRSFNARRVGFTYTGDGQILQVVPTRIAGQYSVGKGGALFIHDSTSPTFQNFGPTNATESGHTLINSEISML